MKNKYLKVTLLSFILACILVVPGIIKGNGVFSICADFNLQQIPFGISANESIKEGQISFDWNNDLGSDFIGTFSFYNLGSIFFLISLIFPPDLFPYLIGPLYIIKIVLAALFAYMFIERYIKNKDYAVIGALLYAFSGYHITSLLFHFQDIYLLFPLMLYALDKTMLDNKKGLFLITVALNCFANYFMFVGEVVFLIIYFVIKLLTKQYKLTTKKFITLAFESVLGVGITAILLIPSLLFVMSNPRIDGTWTLRNSLILGESQLIEIIRGLILAPDIMTQKGLFFEFQYTSAELYLPLFGVILYSAYIIKKPKNWTSVLIITSLLFMLVPILNSSFFAFTTNYYARWFYMPILIMALASSQALDEKIDIKNGYIALGLVSIFFFLLCLRWNFKYQLFFHTTYFLVNLLIALSGYVFLAIVYKFKNNKKVFVNLLLLGVFGISFANIFVFNYKYDYLSSKVEYTEKYIKNDLKLEYLKDGERTDSNMVGPCNLNYVLNIPNLNNFNTSIGGKIFSFYKTIDIKRDVHTFITDENPKVRDFLSVKYVILDNLEPNDKELIEKGKYYSVIENENYLEMGIPYKYYISEEKYQNLDTKTKQDVISYAVVLNNDQIKKYDYLLDEINLDNLERYNTNYENHIKELNNKIERDFKYTKNGATLKLKTDKERFIVLSIPNENGWKIKINDKEINQEEVYGGLIGLTINEGENNIKLEYTSPGIKAAIIITIISVISSITYVVISKKIFKIKL